MKKIMVLSALLCVFFSSCNTSGDSSDVYYTVSFNSNGGSFVTAQSIKSGETAKQPVSPIRENYIFNGWYKGSYKFYFSTPITESITLTAKWKAETAPGTEEGNTKTYTITYNTTYGTKPSSISLAENTVLTEEHLPTLSVENKIFAGWYNGETKVKVGDKITGNLNLIAKWEGSAATYTITYTTEYGTNPSTISLEENTVLTEEHLPTLTAENKIFAGWYNDETKVNIGDKITGNLNLTAKWEDDVVEKIKQMTNSGEIKVTGKATTELISEINKSLKELATSNKDILVTLDLSEVTGLTCLEGAYSYSDAEYASKSFYGCSNLEGIIFPNTLEEIGSSAFKNCTNLKSIIVPDSVTSIGSGAFSGCTALEEITLPFVGESATAENQSQKSLFGYIFGSSSYVGAITTEQRYFYTSYTEKNATYYLPPLLKKVTITGEKILDYAFYNCSSLTNITIGSGVTSIGSSAFYNCKNLTDVNYTGTVAQWCKISFSGSEATPCTYSGKLCVNGEEITDLVIPDEVTTIKAYAFYNCKGIKSVTIGSGVTSIGNYAFAWCSGLTGITIPDSVTEIGNTAFYGCSGLTNITIGNGVTSIGWSAFERCSGLKSVTIGSGVTSIGSSAFSGCSELTSLTIPDNITSIGYKACYECTSLASVIIGGGVKTIGGYAFSNCSALTSVVFSDTSTWYYSDNSAYTDGSAIDSAELENAATAANYLTNTYKSKYWYKL
ncbi:leucine-rich repeat protein [uncultured Treponema sp.]|uniref:leucine-rich repeat protein n=2 Tax=Treponema TaxID=157 RepID=UPI002624FD11|nr:leucine-rich repeat protein [uncultured Treponema sp.]